MAVRVVGLGAAGGNGLDKESIWDSTVIGSTEANKNGLVCISEFQWNLILETCPPSLRPSHCTQLSYHALQAALENAGWGKKELLDCGFIFASTTAQIDQWEGHLPKNDSEPLPSPPSRELLTAVKSRSLGVTVHSLCEHFAITGPNNLIASSCSASLQAIGLAFLWLKKNKVKRCIVGGTEIHSELTRTGFNSLRLISKDPCKPFDRSRSGINLGEGSAFICLENDDDLSESTNWGYLCGIGMTCDAFHSTSPRPEGIGSRLSMKMALNMAGLSEEQIDWVYAHGTGSAANDLAEANSIFDLFSASGSKMPWVTSTKAVHGHTLATSGVLESMLGIMAMRKGCVLGTANCQDPDPNLKVRVAQQTQSQQVRYFLKNSLGFGGINSSAIFASERPRI